MTNAQVAASEDKFMGMYWPVYPAMLQDIRDHAHACRLRADAGDAPWGRLAAFTASMTRRSLPDCCEVRFNGQRSGTTAALCDLLHDLIMEGV